MKIDVFCVLIAYKKELREALCASCLLHFSVKLYA